MKDLKSLKELYLGFNSNISGFTPIGNLLNLEKIRLGMCRLSSIEFLKELKKLTEPEAKVLSKFYNSPGGLGIIPSEEPDESHLFPACYLYENKKGEFRFHASER